MAGIGSGGEENFQRTVRRPVDLTLYRKHLTPAEWRDLEAKHGRAARVWGIPPGRDGSSVRQLEPGDSVWFHHKGYVLAISEVVTVLFNPDFDNALWGASPYSATGFVFTLTPPTDAHISKARINELLGYKPLYTWQGNRLLSVEVSKLLMKHARP